MQVKPAAALAFALAVSAWQTAFSQETPLTVRVLVVNFDPLVPGRGRLHQALKWSEPKMLAQGYIDDVRKATRGFVEITIASWVDVDGAPPMEREPAVGLEDYLSDAAKGDWPRQSMDYRRFLKDYDVVKAINTGAVDEVWLFGAPGHGFFEAASVGPGAFPINGGVFGDVPAKRPFAIMGFSYERGVGEMLHNLAHRVEGSMEHAYGSWSFAYMPSRRIADPQHHWDEFSASTAQFPDPGAGNCHFPPNAASDYDYGNPRAVMSSADDWLTYPHLTGKLSPVSAANWGGPDWQRNYMIWWLSHLPHAGGTNPDGRLNNWWRYVFGFNLAHGLEPSPAASSWPCADKPGPWAVDCERFAGQSPNVRGAFLDQWAADAERRWIEEHDRELGFSGIAGCGAKPWPWADDCATLPEQPLEVQDNFRGAWGDEAAQRWVAEHNAALAGGGRGVFP